MLIKINWVQSVWMDSFPSTGYNDEKGEDQTIHQELQAHILRQDQSIVRVVHVSQNITMDVTVVIP